MEPQHLFTYFAPAERSTEEELKQQIRVFQEMPGLYSILDLMPGLVLILNRNRQIVYANRIARESLGITAAPQIHGLRPGELLDCENAAAAPGGCGTSRHCSTCGAVKAIQNALNGQQDVQECRLIRKKSGDALDLRIWSYPISVNQELFDLFVANDISHEKRRYMLERLFFHDIMNTVSGIFSFAEILEEASGEEQKEFRGRIRSLAQRLIDEINSQRDLLKAENNELAVKVDRLNGCRILQEIAELYRQNEIARGKTVQIDPVSECLEINTDGVLLSRVLGNLIKNALEASDEGDIVSVSCRQKGNMAEFSVHNPLYIPPEIQAQIFQRSFSTKGTGRGLGTYSIRLLTERYMHGQVSFQSTPQTGTTFIALYPLEWPVSDRNEPATGST